MDAWVWWLVAALVLGILEVAAGGSLVFLMLAAGAAAAALAAAAGGGTAVTVAVFSLVSVAMLAVVRPVARRHLRQPSAIRTGVDALIGGDALVLERVDARDGRVKLAGEIWSARSFDGSSVHEPGATVQVIQIEGATALVA